MPVAGRARRVLQDDPQPTFFTSAIDGAPRWTIGVLAAVQAAALSLLTLAVPAVAVFVATSSDPANAEVAWTRAVVVATNLWLLAHGVPAELGGATVSVVPLGLTGLAVFTCYASARRSGYATRGGAVAAVAGYVALTALAALVVGTSVGGVLRAVLGGLVVAVLGLGGGLLRRPEAPPWAQIVAPLRQRVPDAVTVGLRGGLAAAAALLALGSLLTTLWVLAGHATVVDVARGLALDAVGGVVLAFAELAFVPNLVVWAVAWLVGPGFVVGEGTHFAPGEVVAGPMPALPLLGALPGVSGGVVLVAPLLTVGVGVLAGLAVRRWLVPARPRDVLLAAGVVAVTAGVLVALLVAASGGAAGPGRMAHVGANPWWVGVLCALGCGLGAAGASVPFDPTVRAALRARRERRRGDTRDAAPPA
ncbi:PE-PGRS family protein [Cellulomonas flavigena DSM 20109]|uniref:PE-PGRS family protein n=1 Tax=Cellulomonas flavigena (strain ATCC 482 / DSM 20109 / BCRC 11376 / JCM 18109 / NBRC 3775 / NCIMB 8073 / NRS 134) TaxID=446466 RepID=D5UI78_CELFN|nr:PE-PGRS family protein [Cellulomonas flavigena DSM 20109]